MSFEKGVACCVAYIRNNCGKAKHYYVCSTGRQQGLPKVQVFLATKTTAVAAV